MEWCRCIAFGYYFHKTNDRKRLVCALNLRAQNNASSLHIGVSNHDHSNPITFIKQSVYSLEQRQAHWPEKALEAQRNLGDPDQATNAGENQGLGAQEF
jgi:hypothetical protein